VRTAAPSLLKARTGLARTGLARTGLARTGLARTGPAGAVRVWPASTSALCAVVLAAPWVRTGNTTRSGYAFLRAAKEAGLVNSSLSHAAQFAVLALPVLAGFSVAMAVLGARRLGALACALSGMFTVGCSLGALTVFGPRLPFGPWAALALGFATMASAAGCAIEGNRHHVRRRPTRALVPTTSR
jgi:hypothetical protein